MWTIRDACCGTLTLGGTGSGKSTGSGELQAKSMLSAGFGGLVLCAKATERATWERYLRDTGRTDDLIVIGADATQRFNFLAHEITRKGQGAGQVENVLNLLSVCLDASERIAGGGSGREGDSYWKNASRQLCRATIDLVALAKGTITVSDLYRLIISAPTSPEKVRSAEWRAASFCFQCLSEADQRPKSERQAADFALTADYWLVEFPNLSEKTRSVIVSTFTSMVDVLARGLMRELFCTTTTVTPDVAEQGRVIVLDLPVKEFGVIGVLAQVIFKDAFQRSIERRTVEDNTRPVFLWADEAQNWVTSQDMLFQTTCRSSRVATVFMTQNISTVYAALGGTEKAKFETASLFANMSTKIFHANGDPTTNDWAASIIGRSKQEFASGNSGTSSDDEWGARFGWTGQNASRSTSAGFSEAYEWEVQPSTFTQLRTGGPQNGRRVEAIVFQNGRVFNGNGKTWMNVTFEQHNEQKVRSGVQ